MLSLDFPFLFTLSPRPSLTASRGLRRRTSKMKVAVLMLAVLLVAILLVSESEQGWVRRWRVRVRVRRGIRRFGGWVRKHRNEIRTGLVAARFIGKRSVDPRCPPVDGMDQATAQALLDQLKLTCPEFAINPGVGLSKAVVMEAFDAVDVDNDNKLSDSELDNLENVLEAYEVCAEAPPPNK
ncbi:hypothetical protein ACOMHN_052187 [Nucella lapillus]